MKMQLKARLRHSLGGRDSLKERGNRLAPDHSLRKRKSGRSITKGLKKGAWMGSAWIAAAAPFSLAQEISEEVMVLGTQDFLSILPDQDTSSAFGLEKSLVETPRAVTEVREDLIEKFALRSVDDLVRLTPGAFTSSFFGIRGAMDIRGEPADNYYRGFRRIANPGAFNTIVRGAERLEILRGPVSPLYGSGSVGGQLNYIPKTTKSTESKEDGGLIGDLNLTLGSYQQQIISGNLGVALGTGGMHVFFDVEDSESYYDLYEPSSEMVQIAFDFDLSDSTVLEFGGQYQTSDSIQVPGWNRVTQDLIDNKTYITGAPRDRNTGADPIQLLPQESGFITSAADVSINNSFSNVGTFCIPSDVPPEDVVPDGNLAVYNGQSVLCLGGGYFQPIANPGTTQIEHSTTFIDPLDFADSTAITLYAELSHEFDNEAVWKTELFYDFMDHTKYQSWGFTADYPDATVWEFRTSYKFDWEFSGASATTIAGVNYRVEDLELKHAFFDETFDFRDISVGATPNDRIAPAVENPLEGVTFGEDDEGNTIIADGVAQRNYNLHEISENTNAGIFALTDINFGDFAVLLGARYDSFDVDSEDIAETLLGARFNPDAESDSANEFSYNVSLSYNFDSGFSPYVTHSLSNSLSTNQLGGISPGVVESGAFLQESTLTEIGVKFEGLGGSLYTALTYYDQEKIERTGQTSALTETFAEGFEFEMRALVTDALSVIATATHAETEEIGDLIFTVVNGWDFARQNDGIGGYSIDASDTYDGRIAGDRATFVGPGARLERGGLPDNVISIYGTYLFEFDNSDLTVSTGFTWVDSTHTDVFESVELPSYMIWNGSVRYEYDRFVGLLQVNNLTDEDYYTSADLFDSVIVKPSEGTTVSLSLSYMFGD